MSLLKQSLHLVAAIVVVTIQLIAQPIFFGVFGSTTAVESMILIAVMGGICLGQSGILNLRSTRILLMISGVTLILLGVFYSKIIFLGSQSLAGEMIAGLLIILTVISAGVLSSKAIYLDSDIRKNFFWHNLICAFGILTLFFIQIKSGNSVVSSVAGIAVFLISLSHRLWSSSKSFLKIQWNTITLTSLGLGFFSGLYLSSVFEVMELSIFPSGFEFHIYLFLIFIHLAAARYMPVKRIKSSLIPAAACFSFALILILLFGGMNSYYFFDPSLLALKLNSYPFRIAILSSLQVFILLIPYCLFAYVVPKRQLENPEENHLFFVSVGNFLGFIIPGILLNHPPLEILLPLFFLLSLAWWIYFGSENRKAIIALFVVIVGAGGFFLHQPTRRVLVQSVKSRILLTESAAQDKKFGLESIRTIYRKEGKVGFVYKYGDIPGLGLGGYASPLYSSSDLAKSLTSKNLVVEKKAKRILILGLGNQLLLKHLTVLIEGGEKIERIDVVDNFPPYETAEFPLEISKMIDLDSKKLSILQIHNDDAFKFLVKKKYSVPYDLVINNLTWPLYMSSRLTYTKEFYELIKNALTDKGIFITRSFSDDRINCLTIRNFPFTETIRATGGAAILVGSREVIGAGEAASFSGKCSTVQDANLSRLFWGQGLYDQGRQKRTSLMNNVDSRSLIYPVTGSLKEKGEIVERASQLFAEKYQKTILAFDSNSSDIFAQYIYRSLTNNSRRKESVSIKPFFEKDLQNTKELALKSSCSFVNSYKKKFSHNPEGLAVETYSRLLFSYQIKEDCFSL